MTTSDPSPEDLQRTRMAEGWNFLTSLLAAGKVVRDEAPTGRPVIPLTILGGFLGAGKTTLVNHILSQADGLRIFVLVNDFGAINIDEKMIVGRSLGTMTLSNGCVCCSLTGDLVLKLREISRSASPPDAIVLETSGLSDPHGLVHIVETNPAVRIDAIVTVLDGERIQDQAQDPLTAELVSHQISGADLLILNKTDLLDEGQRTQTLHWLNDRAQGRPILQAVQAQVSPDLLVGHHKAGASRPARAAGVAHHFESVSLSCEGWLARDRLQALLQGLPSEVVRAKGVLALADAKDRATHFHRVGRRSSLFPETAQPCPQVSELVVIAPRGALDGAELSRQFTECRTPD